VARRVNRKSRWPLWGSSAARFGRSAEPLCWFCPPQSASPVKEDLHTDPNCRKKGHRLRNNFGTL